jgi:hypothetical protein
MTYGARFFILGLLAALLLFSCEPRNGWRMSQEEIDADFDALEENFSFTLSVADVDAILYDAAFYEEGLDLSAARSGSGRGYFLANGQTTGVCLLTSKYRYFYSPESIQPFLQDHQKLAAFERAGTTLYARPAQWSGADSQIMDCPGYFYVNTADCVRRLEYRREEIESELGNFIAENPSIYYSCLMDGKIRLMVGFTGILWRIPITENEFRRAYRTLHYEVVLDLQEKTVESVRLFRKNTWDLFYNSWEEKYYD